MKNILSIFMAICLFSAIVISCKKTEDKAVMNTEAKASLSVSPNDTIVLNSDSSASIAIRYSWSKPDFGYQAVTNYVLQFSNSSSDWSNAISINIDDSVDALTNKLYQLQYKNFTTQQINTIAINAGIPELSSGSLYTRVKTGITGTKIFSLSDDKRNYIFTNSYIASLKKLYIPGDYQGWSPGSATVGFLEQQINGSGKFSGLIEKTKNDGTLSNGKFKMTPAPNWDYDFGDNGSVYTILESGSGVIGPKSAGTNGTDFNLADGTYFLTVDTVSLAWTYKLENWAIVGDATPLSWPSGSGTDPTNTQDAQNMRYNNVSKMYEITIDLKGGKSILFRKNDAWTSKIAGGTGVAKNAPLDLNQVVVGSGTGEDIGIAVDGNYTIKIDPATYKIFAVKN
jgi:starch-binding outer membrane protein SusE/F